MSRLNIEKSRLTLDGRDFYLAAGDIQYFRIFPDEWERRLSMIKDFGLTAVQTYCPWNLHEPREGEFDFSGLLDLGRFLELCDKLGLKVLLRPSPYICGEWDFGGLPWWLLKDRHMRYRCAHPEFMAKVAAYYKRLCREFVPYLSTNGGPIIARERVEIPEKRRRFGQLYSGYLLSFRVGNTIASDRLSEVFVELTSAGIVFLGRAPVLGDQQLSAAPISRIGSISSSRTSVGRTHARALPRKRGFSAR